MALYAVDDLDDAIEAARAFLLPFSWARWLRMAVIAFFVAGGLGVNSGFNWTTGGTSPATEPGPGGVTPPDLPPGITPADVAAIVLALVAVIVLFALVLGLVGSVMEFVFVESLRSDAVHVRRYFRRYFGPGIRLFAFRVVVTLLGIVVVVALAAVLGIGLLGTDPSTWAPGAVLGAALVLLPVLVVVVAAIALINGFTTAFVVPVMLNEGLGVLAGWRRFWPTLSGQPRQFGAYVLLGIVLTIAIGIVASILTGIAAVVIAIPFAVAAGIAFVLGGTTFTPVVIAAFVILGLAFLLALFVAIALIQVPLQTFLRYYTLLVLGDANEAFDVILETRAAIRDEPA